MQIRPMQESDEEFDRDFSEDENTESNRFVTQKLKFNAFCLQTFRSIVNFDSLTGFQCSTKTIRSNNFFIMDCVFLKFLRVFESLTVAITSIDISRGLKKLKHCSLFVFFSEGV